MGKIIVISGASKGLGLDIYNTLKEYSIATICRNNGLKETSNRISYNGDITNKANVIEFFYNIYKKWGTVDVLINNAGMLGNFKELTLYHEKEIDDLLQTNIKGAVLMIQQALRLMTNGGLIINIGSTRSITGAPNKSIYTMTKFALRGLTQCINAEYNAKNIYSTIICPGSFKTVSTTEVAKLIKHLIELPIESHIPEIIVGGQL